VAVRRICYEVNFDGVSHASTSGQGLRLRIRSSQPQSTLSLPIRPSFMSVEWSLAVGRLSGLPKGRQEQVHGSRRVGLAFVMLQSCLPDAPHLYQIGIA
jgi:hypothetical protein